LYDELGNEFLDCYTITAHVGHCHPHVVSAGQTQMSLLWASQGMLSDPYSEYIKCLLEFLPEKLSVIQLVSSGSEANDLALRLARKYTKRHDVAVFESGFHGNLSSLVDISEKSFRKLPHGKKDFVHIIPLPANMPCSDSSYDQDPEIHLEKAVTSINRAAASGRPVGCFMSEMVVTAAGVIIPPKKYFRSLYKYSLQITSAYFSI